MKLSSIALAVIIVGTPALGAAQDAATPAGHVAVPATPKSVKGILATRRFTLQTPYTNTWSKERAQVYAGTLVVLDVDPAYVIPRDALEPVLYAGDVAVQRLSQGDVSGRVVAIIPGNIDVATVPIWFGSPALPERVTVESARAERARAEKAGVRALASARAAGVQRAAVNSPDMAALLRNVAAPLVEEFSPQEKYLADSWRLREAKAPPRNRTQ
jgi:hypothetical protein